MDDVSAARAAVRRRRKALNASDERYREAVEVAYVAGASLTQLAADADVAVETVRKMLRDRGVDIRPQGKRQ